MSPYKAILGHKKGGSAVYPSGKQWSRPMEPCAERVRRISFYTKLP